MFRAVIARPKNALVAPSGALAKARALLTGELGKWLAVAAFFFIAAVVQTWPLILHAANSIVIWEHLPLDSWVFLWNLWWVKRAIVELQTNPFHTDLLYSPQGTDLYLHTLAFLNGLLSIPLQLATNNLVLSWNVLAFLFFVVSGLGMYALSYRVTGNRAAALVSGYIFAFAPWVLMRLPGHWHLVTIWPIPLFVLFLLRFQETGRLREAIGAGVFWALLTYNALEYGVWAGLLLGLFVVYWSLVYVRGKDWAHLVGLWRGSVLVGGVWFAVAAPLLIPAFVSVESGEYALFAGDEYYSTDLAALATRSPLWGSGAAPVGALPGAPHIPAGGIENTVYLGFVPLALAGLALFSIRRAPHRVLFWGVVFLFFAALALGPYLYIGDTKTLSLMGVSFSIPMPYQLYDQLPLIGVGRGPARMIAFAFVGLAVLAGVGLDVLISWLKPRYMMLAPVVALIVFGLVVLEYWNPPVPLHDPPEPAILKTIGNEPGEFAVLNVPWGRNSGGPWAGDWAGAWLENYHQTVHGKAELGGFISRARQGDIDWVWEQPGLRFLACAQCTQFFTEEDMNGELVQELFRRYRIKYVILRSGNLGFDSYDQYLRTVVGAEPIFSDSALTVYRNPQVE